MDGRPARAWLKVLDIDHAPGFHMLGTAMQLLQDQYINPQHPVHAALKEKYPTWFNDVRNAVAACNVRYSE